MTGWDVHTLSTSSSTAALFEDEPPYQTKRCIIKNDAKTRKSSPGSRLRTTKSKLMKMEPKNGWIESKN
jgi:hypothetical protein